MILPDGKTKILDFGLAKVYDRKSDQFTSSRTEVGTAVGTVNYMSPEQVMGLSLDYRSDIFSLGIVLYEGITGKCPFASKSLFATVENIIRSQPASIAPAIDGVPPELEQIIFKCLEKEARNRFQSCNELTERLKSARNSLPAAVISAEPEVISNASAAPAKKSTRFYIEMTITLLVFLFLIAYLVQSCH